ncbi:MAG TPA: MBL fold metallo-hydrolase [Ramlibacter sp.]|nr:MBL fold metallo-hydrolase [Ramlibacter sp.]
MKPLVRAAVTLLLFAAVAATADPPTPVATRIAAGVWLIAGSFLPGRQPDGNTIVFDGERGVVVMDTGRHAWHTQAILDHAAREGKPVTAILNSHWHLDHASGNERIKSVFPRAPVYATNAVERAAREFWPKSTRDYEAFLATIDPKSEQADDIRGDMHAQTHPAPMLPDVAVSESGVRVIDGRPLQLGVAKNAATDADLWVFDVQSRVLASGDLVTFPVPFLDTACVAGWRRGLDDIAKSPFRVLIPGHGRALSRDEFATYKAAFERFTDCATSAADKSACAAAWSQSTASLQDKPDPRTQRMAEYYVAMLRENGGNSALCAAR